MNFGQELKDLVLAEVGTLEGNAFQKAMKQNHPLAIEFVARLLRRTTHHNGPVLRHEIDPWLRRDAVEEFKAYLSPDGDDASGGSSVPKTNNTKLVSGPTVYVSPDGGTTNEPFPKPGVEYAFCIDVTNAGQMPSGEFYVRFSLDGGNGSIQTFDFQQKAGLDAGRSVNAAAHFGSFADEDIDYTLSACVYSPSAPDTAISCAGTFGFNPRLNAP